MQKRQQDNSIHGQYFALSKEADVHNPSVLTKHMVKI